MVLLVSENAARSVVGERLIQMLVTLASKSSAHCCVELDHAKDLDTVRMALERGVNAIMADGASLSYLNNVDFVRAAVDVARSYSADVEAELGVLTGSEDSLRGGANGMLTDANEAQRFVLETNVDCLAVSVGNVHGHYVGDPNLNWSRLQEIRRLTNVPLALHGVSGLNEKDLAQAVESGVTKFNVNTELREIYFREVGLLLGDYADTLDVLAVELRLTDRLRAAVGLRLQSERDFPQALS